MVSAQNFPSSISNGFGPALKTMYPDDKVNKLTYKDFPFLALIPKDENFYGLDLAVPLVHGNPQGRSASFYRAQSGVTEALLKRFTITRAKDYGIIHLDNETLEASEKDVGAFLANMQVQVDGIFEQVANSAAQALFGDGSGSIGQISAIGNGDGTNDLITLTNADDIVNYEVNQRLVLAAAKTTGSCRGTGGSSTDSNSEVIVRKVDRDNGKFYVGSDLSTAVNITSAISGAATGDYIFVNGDRNSKAKGVDAYIPSSAPSAGESFWGVDRSVDSSRLAGIRVTGTGLSIEEALIKGMVKGGREGAKFDYYFVSYTNFGNLENSLGSKVQYVDVKGYNMANIGFTGIQLKSPSGIVTVLPDPKCPAQVAYGINMSTWKCRSLKKMSRILNLDGNKFLRISDADANEMRIGGYYQYVTNNPGQNIRVSLDT